MTYFSKSKGTTAKVICVVLFVIIFVCGVFSALGIGMKGLFQIIMFASAVAIIQISQKYIMSSLEYILDPYEEITVRNRLTVIKTVGKKRTPLTMLGLVNLTDVIPYKKPSELVSEYGEISQKVSFCTDIFPKESYLLMFEVNGKLTSVRLECDAKFADELKKRAGV